MKELMIKEYYGSKIDTLLIKNKAYPLPPFYKKPCHFTRKSWLSLLWLFFKDLNPL